ncbi:MAG: DUF99 family protein [Pseudomonadota bacterium]|nr:DUF99 family protein [Pseudomonadota bacterium]
MALSNVVGFDDAPFARNHRGNVRVIGTVYARSRLDGVLSGTVRRDGINATATLIHMIENSHYQDHLQAVFLQGIALAGFNIIDLARLHRALGLPIVVVARKRPDLASIRSALLERVPGGQRKWALIERLPPMTPAAGVFIQTLGLTLEEATTLVERFALHGKLPEPIRTAHLVARGITAGGRHRHRP